MVSITLYVTGGFSHTIDFPENWNELTVAELEIVAAAQINHGNSEPVSKAVVLTSIIEQRAKQNGIELPSTWKESLDFEAAATQGFDAINFLYTTNNRTINPYPTLTVGGKRMIGPADDFDSITCGEMEDCEVFFMQMVQEPSINKLAHIAAILWRPRNAPYKAKQCESRIPAFEALPLPQLFAIYMWYTGCRNNLPLYFPKVYGGGSNTSTTPDLTAFTKCIHAGAGAKNGLRENIRAMLAKEFLFDMNLEAEQAEEMRKKYERQ
ncbi:hypothetical protein ACFOWM_03400 [Ferruginibacter yonginensis]|uniref:Uncharacterized protein n=1 Tax=Ferruginibacter yonginensis TaxID=1310416 RepID=A0ABV8QP56_9BACT